MNEDNGGGQRPDKRQRPGRLGAALARAALVSAALAGAALLAAGCGGGSPAAAPSPAPGNVQQLDVFAACMRGHGVLNFYFSSSPGTSNSSTVLSVMGHYVTGVNPQTSQFGAAMKSCKHLLPGGGPHQMTRQQINSQVKFAACMRSHGYPDYPDPVVQNGGVEEQPLPSNIDTISAQFQTAQQTCSSS
jgi:hypothetical protein